MAKYFLYALIIGLFLNSCSSDQRKAENEIKKIIIKYSTYPKSYDPIKFLNIEKVDSDAYKVRYNMGHMYRIKCSDGKDRVMEHTFTVVKINDDGRMFVEIQPFERWE